MKNLLYLVLTGLFLTTSLSACVEAAEIKSRKSNLVEADPIVKVVSPSNLGSIKKLTVTDFEALLATGEATLIDVRTPEEFAAGHIKGAVNINFKKRTFPSYISAIDKDKPTAIYCRSGNRSGKADLIMQSLGFKTINDLAKGYKAWVADGKSVVTTDNKANEALQTELSKNAPKSMALTTLGKGLDVDLAEFEKLINSNQVTLVDVRTAKEFAEGHIKSAVNVDWKNRHFADNILKISNAKPVAIYCRSGNRSTRAKFAMLSLGFSEVINLENGFKSWVAANKSIETNEVKGDIRRLDVENFNNAIVSNAGVLVDVRTPREYSDSHIPGAINIDFKNSSFIANFNKLGKDTPVLIYCRSGARSGRAMKALEKNGFKVYNLGRGFIDWGKKGMKVEGKNTKAAVSGGEEGC